MKELKTVQLMGGSKDGAIMDLPPQLSSPTSNLHFIVIPETKERYAPQTELERLTGVWTLVAKK